MSNIHFKHNIHNKNRYTFAFSLPTKAELLDLVNNFKNTINLKFAYVYVHPQDTYSREIGRNLVYPRIRTHVFKLVGLYNIDNRYIIVLTNNEFDIELSIVNNSNNAHIESINESHILPDLKEEE